MPKAEEEGRVDRRRSTSIGQTEGGGRNEEVTNDLTHNVQELLPPDMLSAGAITGRVDNRQLVGVLSKVNACGLLLSRKEVEDRIRMVTCSTCRSNLMAALHRCFDPPNKRHITDSDEEVKEERDTESPLSRARREGLVELESDVLLRFADDGKALAVEGLGPNMDADIDAHMSLCDHFGALLNLRQVVGSCDEPFGEYDPNLGRHLLGDHGLRHQCRVEGDRPLDIALENLADLEESIDGLLEVVVTQQSAEEDGERKGDEDGVHLMEEKCVPVLESTLRKFIQHATTFLLRLFKCSAVGFMSIADELLVKRAVEDLWKHYEAMMLQLLSDTVNMWEQQLRHLPEASAADGLGGVPHDSAKEALAAIMAKCERCIEFKNSINRHFRPTGRLYKLVSSLWVLTEKMGCAPTHGEWLAVDTHQFRTMVTLTQMLVETRMAESREDLFTTEMRMQVRLETHISTWTKSMDALHTQLCAMYEDQLSLTKYPQTLELRRYLRQQLMEHSEVYAHAQQEVYDEIQARVQSVWAVLRECEARRMALKKKQADEGAVGVTGVGACEMKGGEERDRDTLSSPSQASSSSSLSSHTSSPNDDGVGMERGEGLSVAAQMMRAVGECIRCSFALAKDRIKRHTAVYGYAIRLQHYLDKKEYMECWLCGDEEHADGKLRGMLSALLLLKLDEFAREAMVETEEVQRALRLEDVVLEEGGYTHTGHARGHQDDDDDDDDDKDDDDSVRHEDDKRARLGSVDHSTDFAANEAFSDAIGATTPTAGCGGACHMSGTQHTLDHAHVSDNRDTSGNTDTDMPTAGHAYVPIATFAATDDVREGERAADATYAAVSMAAAAAAASSGTPAHVLISPTTPTAMHMTPIAATTTVGATNMAVSSESSPCRERGTTNDVGVGAGSDSAASPVNAGTSSMQTAMLLLRKGDNSGSREAVSAAAEDIAAGDIAVGTEALGRSVKLDKPAQGVQVLPAAEEIRLHSTFRD